MQIEVNRLRFKGASDSPHHQAFLIEDALNTLLSAEQRLVLVRRVELDRPMAGGHADSRAAVARNVAQGWSRIIGGACHGASDSAASANVVWFADAAEAKAALLARLLKGHSVDAWYWRLAVRLWRGQPLAHWVADEMREADGCGDNGQALAMIVDLLRAGKGDVAQAALLQYFDLTTDAWHGPLTNFAALGFVPQKAQPFGQQTESRASAPEEQAMFVAAWLPAIAKRIPFALPTILRRLNLKLPDKKPVLALIEKFVARYTPELSLRPELLKIAAQQFFESVVLEKPVQPLRTSPAPRPFREKPGAKSALPPPPGSRGEAAPVAHPLGQRSEARTEPGNDEPHQNSDLEARLPPRELPVARECKSSAAGLFYLFNPLRELGWPEWLAARPNLLACNPTAILLNAIASHHRVEPTDPVFAFLSERIEPDATLDPAILHLWRIALDRWLKRSAHIKLARLVAKPGWLGWHNDRLTVRFRLGDIDIRLRRQAIDRDPGWMMWAGLSVRFAYSDRPIFEDDAG